MHTFGCITAHNEKDLLLPSSSTSDNYNEKAHVTEVQSLEIEVGFGWNTQISARDRGGKKIPHHSAYAFKNQNNILRYKGWDGVF